MNILVLIEPPGKNGQLVLLQHQAILSIARAILASPSEKGLTMSGHKMLVPANADIMALLAVVANDYSEQLEPENERDFLPPPFVLYRDEAKSSEIDMVKQFNYPRWFDNQFAEDDIIKVIYTFKPEACLLIGEPENRLMRNLDYRFNQVIGFSALSRNQDAKRFYPFQNMSMADDTLESEMERNADFEKAGKSFWQDLFLEDEDLPKLEPFVAFGPALEMAMFIAPGLK